MEFAEINYEIHFLIKLPDYLKEKQQELNNIDDYIKLPVMKLNELGELTGDCPPTEVQALKISGIRTGIEKDIERAIKKGQRLVNAINSLDEADKNRLIDYYLKGTNDDIKPLFKRLWELYTNERDKDNIIKDIHWRERVKERARILKEQQKGVMM